VRTAGPVCFFVVGNYSLQQRLVKTWDRLIKPARNYWLLAESNVTRRLFVGILRE
jgi:hypothetical protein